MMKNARSLLENAKNDKFDRVKVRDKFMSKNEIIKFKKKIIKGDMNDNNKLREYFTHLKSIRSTLNNAPKKSNDIKKHIKYLDHIKKILSIDDNDHKNISGKIRADEARSFKDQKGKGHVNLPILLSKIYTNNNSKELINDIKQLVKDLYDNKQIIKQVYNILIKAITYKNDS